MTILALSPREAQVARALAVDCLSAKEAAERLGIAYRTVETHRTTILNKLGLHRTMELARVMAIHGPQCGRRE